MVEGQKQGAVWQVKRARPIWAITTFLLWCLITALGIAEVVIAVDLVMASYSALLKLFGVITEAYGREYWTGFNVQTISALILGVGVLVLSIGSGEFFLRNYGTVKAWRLAGFIVGGEFLILVLGYFVAPDAGYLIGLLFS